VRQVVEGPVYWEVRLVEEGLDSYLIVLSAHDKQIVQYRHLTCAALHVNDA
jgi:hypothetical protein